MNTATVFVISGGEGSSGERIARTALAQFQNPEAVVQISAHVRTTEQLKEVMAQAAATPHCIVLHTLVNASLREELVHLAARDQIAAIDLMGSLLEQLARHLGQEPLGMPGLYHKMREQDLKRIEAIEFTIEHDDGKRVQDIAQAEIVLCGVSRVGKTPLSIYLSTQGWKVTNIPLVKGVEPPPALFKLDRARVVGLTIEAGQLISYRRTRGQLLGRMRLDTYTEPEQVAADLEFARSIFKRGGFAIVNTTDKPIEESAQEIIRCVTRATSL